MVRLFKHYVPYAVLLLGFIDLILLFAAAEVAWNLRANQINMDPGAIETRIVPLVTFALSQLTALIAVGAYSPESLQSLRFVTARLLVAVSLGAIFLSVVHFLMPDATLWRSNSLYAMGLALGFLFGVRLLLGSMFGGETFKRRLVVLGAGKKADRIRQLEEKRGAGFLVVGYIAMTDAEQLIPQAIKRSAIFNLSDFVVRLNASEVVLAMEERRNAIPMTFLERETGRVDLDTVNPSWLIFSDGFSAGQRISAMFKRLFDVLASALLLVMTSPLILIGALLVRLDSKGSAFYRQARVGLYGEEFTILKLRTMRSDAETNGNAQWAEKDDPRITRIGKFLRKVRIDELPQTWNVLKGDMSFVGPRPERRQFVEDLEQKLRYYGERHMVKPGITGWAQINYPYGASIEDSRHKLEYDLYYAKNYSPFLDVLILVQTLRVVLWPDGAR
jgi:sugar transferase (PEP-CTERM system associated)